MRSLYLWLMFPKKLQAKLNTRNAKNALRKLDTQNSLVDFSSNDYLGFAKNESIFKAAHNYLTVNNITQNGATGSRLLSGNHNLYNELEQQLCEFHNSDAALIFNSGYDANLGFFSCVPQRGDLIFYDEYIHASIRDGITMSNAKAYKFKHNNIEDLKEKMLRGVYLERSRKALNDKHDIYIVTESVFSMDGDTPDLEALSKLSKENNCHLIIDEAHAIGVFGAKGYGLTQNIDAFAKTITFGKAMGCHAAAILGSKKLKDYLINFSRAFIYTTGLPPHSLATIQAAYNELEKTSGIKKLQQNISFFKSEINRLSLSNVFIESNSAIHCCIISGNDKVKSIAENFNKNSFSVKPILSPTVKKGDERLRFCLHAFNTKDEISQVLNLLTTFVR